MMTACEETTISEANFHHLQQVVQRKCGLHLEPRKKDLIFMRVRRRLNIAHPTDLRDWCDRLAQPGREAELQELIDEVTTQHTKFFRENVQLDYLRQWILPEIQRQGRTGTGKKIRVWSAGCSSGEEPYTLAIILLETLGTGWDVRILASDICQRALHKAVNGLYAADSVAEMAPDLLAKYFDPVRDGEQPAFRVKPLLRERIDFRQINFMDARYPINTAFEIIFCRNVIIYFDQANRERLLARFADYLQPDNGYLFLGHSEIVTGIPTLQKRKLNIFQKMGT
ncbi:MAG: chemotaxis protein CheR [Magnetococcales bacterium]|nr:chemotaxis protein CheR [Magnetococcales bacterium]